MEPGNSRTVPTESGNSWNESESFRTIPLESGSSRSLPTLPTQDASRCQSRRGSFPGRDSRPRALLQPTPQEMATGSEDGSLRLWQLIEPVFMAERQPSPPAAAAERGVDWATQGFSGRGAFGDHMDDLPACRAATPEPIPDGENEPGSGAHLRLLCCMEEAHGGDYVSALGYAPSGRTLASLSAFAELKLWTVVRHYRKPREKDDSNGTSRRGLARVTRLDIGGAADAHVPAVPVGNRSRHSSLKINTEDSEALWPTGATLVPLYKLPRAHELLGNAQARASIAFAPDGLSVATVVGMTLRVWSTPAGAAVEFSKELQLSSGGAVACYAPDGYELAIGDTTGALIVLWTGHLPDAIATPFDRALRAIRVDDVEALALVPSAFYGTRTLHRGETFGWSLLHHACHRARPEAIDVVLNLSPSVLFDALAPPFAHCRRTAIGHIVTAPVRVLRETHSQRSFRGGSMKGGRQGVNEVDGGFGSESIVPSVLDLALQRRTSVNAKACVARILEALCRRLREDPAAASTYVLSAAGQGLLEQLIRVGAWHADLLGAALPALGLLHQPSGIVSVTLVGSANLYCAWSDEPLPFGLVNDLKPSTVGNFDPRVPKRGSNSSNNFFSSSTSSIFSVGGTSNLRSVQGGGPWATDEKVTSTSGIFNLLKLVAAVLWSWMKRALAAIGCGTRNETRVEIFEDQIGGETADGPAETDRRTPRPSTSGELLPPSPPLRTSRFSGIRVSRTSFLSRSSKKSPRPGAESGGMAAESGGMATDTDISEPEEVKRMPERPQRPSITTVRPGDLTDENARSWDPTRKARASALSVTTVDTPVSTPIKTKRSPIKKSLSVFLEKTDIRPTARRSRDSERYSDNKAPASPVRTRRRADGLAAMAVALRSRSRDSAVTGVATFWKSKRHGLGADLLRTPSDADRTESALAATYTSAVVPLCGDFVAYLAALEQLNGRRTRTSLYDNATTIALVHALWAHGAGAMHLAMCLAYAGLLSVTALAALTITGDVPGYTLLVCWLPFAALELGSAITAANFREYVSSPYNWADWLNYLLLALVSVPESSQKFAESTRCAYAALLVLMGVKVLFYLRAYTTLVATILQAFIDMGSFALIVLLILVSFAAASSALVEAGTADRTTSGPVSGWLLPAANSAFLPQFALMFGYMDIADFEVDAANSPTSIARAALFYAFSGLVTIVLLNLLITILSNSYDQSTERRRAELMRMRAQLIVEYHRLLPSLLRPRGRYVHVLASSAHLAETRGEFELEGGQKDDEWASRLSGLKLSISAVRRESAIQSERLEEKVANLGTQLALTNSTLHSVLASLQGVVAATQARHAGAADPYADAGGGARQRRRSLQSSRQASPGRTSGPEPGL